MSIAEWDRKKLKKGRSSKMAKSDRLILVEDSLSVETIVEHPNSLIVESKAAADDEIAWKAFKPKPKNDEMMAGMTDMLEPNQDEEATTVKVYETEPKKRRLIKKSKNKMKNAKKRRRRRGPQN